MTLTPTASISSPIALPAQDQIGWRGWLLVISVTVALRVVVIASGAVSFHSDEAIVGLMARHINAGLPLPTFFYGQPYMGSLDAILIAVSFRLFGESVLSIRLVQASLYLLTVVVTVLLTKRMTQRAWAAVAAGLLVAVPPVVLTLYTSVTLGGYGETLLFGQLILLLGWDLGAAQPVGNLSLAWRWLLLGLISGLGWWVDGLIVFYLVPVALYLAWRLLWPLCSATLSQIKSQIKWIALAGVLFVIGGLPWWLYNFSHNWEALHFLIGGSSGASISTVQRLLGLLFIGLPAIIGARFPWTPTIWTGAAVGLLLAVYVSVIIYVIAQARRSLKAGMQRAVDPNMTRAARFMLLVIACTMLIFIVSGFGFDSTGRYLLPLVPEEAILVALVGGMLWRNPRYRKIAYGLIGGFLVFGLVGNAVALANIPPGLTTQFSPSTDFRNDSDQAVIDFLLSHNGTRGYGTYWVAFRLAFASQERIILDAQLPYKSNLSYNLSDRRYPPYTELVRAATAQVYVTANMPQIDALIAEKFGQAGIIYKRQSIGPYTVFYDLSQSVTPEKLGLESMSPPVP